MPDTGNTAQARMIADQVADATIMRFMQQYGTPPQPAKADVPGPLKWAAGIVSALMAAGVATMCFWVVSTLSELQQTVTRIDERQKLVATSGDDRFKDVERRIATLESYHRNQSGPQNGIGQ